MTVWTRLCVVGVITLKYALMAHCLVLAMSSLRLVSDANDLRVSDTRSSDSENLD